MKARQQQWPWFAILARAGSEKNAKLLLENAGYECYFPVSRYTGSWSDTTGEIEVPLFPGYVFCRMDPRNRLPVLTTPGVIHIVGVDQTPIPVEDDEIAAIERVGKSSLATMPWPYLRAGQTARIEEGPLKGLTGIVVKFKYGVKLVLSVNLLQCSIAVEIDRNWLSSTRQVRPVTNQGPAYAPVPHSLDSGSLETTPGR